MIWENVVPEHVAMRQRVYERAQYVLRARSCGLTLQKIADKLGLCRERVRQLERRAKKWKVAPVTKFLTTNGDLAALHKKLHRLESRL